VGFVDEVVVIDDWVSRLDELGVSRRDCDLRLSDGGRIVSAVGETDIGLMQRGDGDRWNREIG
jgi:hypothetical protein